MRATRVILEVICRLDSISCVVDRDAVFTVICNAEFGIPGLIPCRAFDVTDNFAGAAHVAEQSWLRGALSQDLFEAKFAATTHLFSLALIATRLSGDDDDAVKIG